MITNTSTVTSTPIRTAILTRMRRRHHADELHDICHALEAGGKTAAAEKLAEALHYFDHCNEYLAEAVELAKGE